MIAAIGVDKKPLRSAGFGKITIDSGVAESLLPANAAPNETLIEWREDGEHGREESEIPT